MTGSNDARLLDLARRLLDGEVIDWEKEGVAEAEVREGMKQLERIIGRPGEATLTRHAPDSVPPAPAEPPSHSLEDRVIGGFRLVRKLGEGGMGVVYEAEQKHPRRAVALKVIRGGALVSPDTLKLFRREIQTLARLSHSGIAQLYETGITDDGMHFFAMELVRGETLSDWLRSRPKGPMTPAEMKIRLGVFRKICDAVAYAHQKGVIHRDLKPGNILIPKPVEGSSIQDVVPDVKVLDFGLARITDSDVQATTFVTEMGKVQGTLPYMSPEQVRGNPDEIDLRTDVYSLGVMLYELVAGRLPYDISKAQLHEAVRIICEDPPRSLTSTFTGTKRLDADVVTIAAKCLEKEAARRYQSAAALGEEIQRYLTHQPILARPPSAAYQFRKLVLRHKGPFAAAAAAFVLLAVFAGAMTVQAVRIGKERDRASQERDRADRERDLASQERDRANQEADTAREVSTFLEGLFEVSDPWATQANSKWKKQISPSELLDTGAERVERELKDRPAIQARLLRTIATAYGGLGLGEKRGPLVRRAAELTERTYGSESLEYADALNLREGQGDNTRAHEIRTRLLKPDDPRMASSLYYLARAQPQVSDKLTSMRRALDIVEASPKPDDRLDLWILNDLALLLSDYKGDHAGAITLLRKALAIRERIYPASHVEHAMGLSNLGNELMLVGQLQEARSYFESSLTIMEGAVPPGHLHIAVAAHYLGELELLDGRLDRARALLERAIVLFNAHNYREESRRTGFGDTNYIETLKALGLVAEAQGRLTEALDLLGRAHEIYSRFQEPIPSCDSAADYARVLRKAGRIADAEKIEAGESIVSAK